MNSIEKAIISTLSYFDIFDYPLTAMEIWKWLYVDYGLRTTDHGPRTTDYGPRSVRLVDIQEILDSSDFLKQRVESKNSFYYLKGRDEIVTTRAERYSLAERKYYKIKRVIRILRFVPFVKMIAVCNTLAYNNSRRQADIDLFIITKRRRVWQSRFWVAGFLALFKLRPRPGQTQDAICSTFFVDEESLNLEKLAFENDIYLSYWIRQVVPVYDEGVYQKFIKDNLWVKERLPNSLLVSPSSRRFIKKISWLKWLFNIIGFFLPESLFKNYQLKVMPSRLKEMANKDSRVVINDHMLKFHDNDRRQQFLQSWQTRREQVL